MNCQFDESLVCVWCGAKARKPGSKRNCTQRPKDSSTMFDYVSRYAKAVAGWLAAGRPVRSDAEVERLLAICQGCEHYDGSGCAKCGCKVNRSKWAMANKLRMATEACPLDKWGPAGATTPKRAMRVGIVTPNLISGGVERWAITLAKYLPRHGIDVAGVAFTGTSTGVIDDSTAAEMAAACPVVGAVDSQLVHRVARSEEAIYAVAKGADLLLVWSLTGHMVDAVRACGVPAVGVSHGCNDWWMKSAADAVAHWVAVSEAAARPVPGDGVVIPNGIDLDRIKPTASRSETLRAAGIPEGVRVAVSVGRLSREKRLPLAAAALRYLPPDWWLWLVGDGPADERSKIIEAAGDQAGRLVISPSRSDIGNVLAAADVALLLSEAEGYGLAPVEALAACVPLVATPVGILPELPGIEWLRLHPTPHEVAAAIQITPREALMVERQSARYIIHRDHSADAMARRWAAYLQWITIPRTG